MKLGSGTDRENLRETAAVLMCSALAESVGPSQTVAADESGVKDKCILRGRSRRLAETNPVQDLDTEDFVWYKSRRNGVDLCLSVTRPLVVPKLETNMELPLLR